MLSKGRADDLLNRPLQKTDLLLHEAGVPPLHTTFKELAKLPNDVKKKMYVVHSSNIPDEFDLRKAPTGTAGTLRLDDLQDVGGEMARYGLSTYVNAHANSNSNNFNRFEDDDVHSPWDKAGGEYIGKGAGKEDSIGRNSIVLSGRKSDAPIVSMRPTSNTDSWYMLNLLQAVPFLTRYVE